MIAVFLQTEKFYDLLGTGSFAALAIGSLLASHNIHARKVRSSVDLHTQKVDLHHPTVDYSQSVEDIRDQKPRMQA